MITRALFASCAVLSGLGLTGCNYVGTMVRQSYYSAQLSHAPRNRIYKHLLDRDTYFVFGQVGFEHGKSGAPTAVVAVSDFPVLGEVVDVSHFVRSESYYGLNLPIGSYRLLVVRDANEDGFYTALEITATRSLQIDATAAPEKVIANFDLPIGSAPPPRGSDQFRIAVPPTPALAESVFYPKGTIRSLDDPIFDRAMAEMGLYEPAAFMEAAPMMFYALEEDLGYKIPVIFVHGIGGSAREFADVAGRLDLRRYRVWFFHYPSGGDLEQLGAMFYEIFLSGNTVPHQQTPIVIVAHSMGGLVVREAFNRCRGTDRESTVGSLITLASPFGGHDAARRALHAPVVLPSWRNLDPDSAFIQGLHRQSLPPSVVYHLFTAEGDSATKRRDEATDGVVPLARQLDSRALAEAQEQRGFPVSHTGILHDPEAIAAILATIGKTVSPIPADHFREFDRGGYDTPLPRSFSPIETYMIRHLGHYMDALASGTIHPLHPAQQQFLDEIAGRRSADLPAATAWLKYQRLRPDPFPLPKPTGS